MIHPFASSSHPLQSTRLHQSRTVAVYLIPLLSFSSVRPCDKPLLRTDVLIHRHLTLFVVTSPQPHRRPSPFIRLDDILRPGAPSRRSSFFVQFLVSHLLRLSHTLRGF